MAVAGDAQDQRDEQSDFLDAIGDEYTTYTVTAASSGVETAAEIVTAVAEVRALIAAALKAADVTASDLSPALEAVSRAAGGTYYIAATKASNNNKAMDSVFGVATAAAVAGKFTTYSEVNATVTGSVSTDNGVTITAAVSVDAGTGYDFADDDGFDAAKTNGVSLDNITIATAMGTFKIDENAVTHLVDGDDDGNADVLYTNTFGSASVSIAMDVSEDLDPTAANAKTVWVGTIDSLVAETAYTHTAAQAADVQWSAKVSMPVAGGTAYVAMDEEGGNIFGASTTLSGIGISFSSKLEALEEELSIDRENNIGLTYAMGATTLGASWNSKEDGDQWGISAAYAADGMSLSASTDEGSDWSVSGSMALGGGASAVAGTNYTEDAYLGLSFAF